MKEFLPEIDDLIAKVLTEEASRKEQVELQTWLKESPDNEQYFEALKRIWTESTEAAPALDVNTDVAWAKVKQRIHAPKPLTVKWLSLGNVLRAAAAILLLFTVLQFLNKTEKPIEQTYAANTKIENTTLTDGSAITLNKKSSVTTVFSKKERRVRMTGEAYFAVAKDTEKPFIIDVNTLEVKVVGTAFKIDNLSQPNQIIVVVDEGIVEVKGRNNEVKRLTKKQKAVYDIVSGNFVEVKLNDDVNAMAFKSREWIFEKKALKEVVAKINEFYNSSVEIVSPSLENCPINTVFTFDKQSLDDVLDNILSMYELDEWKMEKKDGKIFLSGKGCE
jgi:transmembrane sensor